MTLYNITVKMQEDLQKYLIHEIYAASCRGEHSLSYDNQDDMPGIVKRYFHNPAVRNYILNYFNKRGFSCTVIAPETSYSPGSLHITWKRNLWPKILHWLVCHFWEDCSAEIKEYHLYPPLTDMVWCQEWLMGEIRDEAAKGKCSLCFNKNLLGRYRMFFDDGPVMQDYLVNYFNSHGFHCVIDSCSILIDWSDKKEEYKSEGCFNLASNAAEFVDLYKRAVTEEIEMAVENSVRMKKPFTVSFDKSACKSHMSILLWLVDETKRYCNVQKGFFDCKIEETKDEIKLIFSWPRVVFY